jgi:hypothetical protein
MGPAPNLVYVILLKPLFTVAYVSLGTICANYCKVWNLGFVAGKTLSIVHRLQVLQSPCPNTCICVACVFAERVTSPTTSQLELMAVEHGMMVD